MNPQVGENKAIAFSRWLYQRLLWAYPLGHREEYGASHGATISRPMP